ncbi:aminobutyraldehyde dehydrogenase [Betaproteobacteria bacterium]|nr:aminobutyraldehyde dehydrogenase [Betaproteobacteria bacterium]GHU40239.1 aminobutyraldehyde dehydrogenase [Betaproteobacteria bacterium]
MPSSDFIVIGAGVIGLAVARELKRQYAWASVRVLEKEAEPGRHSSGRNSGVLHSGIYYAPGSLKAELCRKGRAEMAAYHAAHHLPLNRCGKILVPTSPKDAPQLENLYRRAHENGVRAEKLDEATLRELEPAARSATGEALWVPDTAVGTPGEVLKTLTQEVRALGVEVCCRAEVAKIDAATRKITLRHGEALTFGYAVNAAGLHSDRIAHEFGMGQDYALLPFKGLYWKLSEEAGIRLNHLIYPVPDARTLTLGVHTTTATDGTIYLGPTAVPAFGREHYRGLESVRLPEAARMTRDLARMFLHDRDGYRQQAWLEGRRYFRRWFFEAVRELLPAVKPEHLLPAAKVGLHPRLFDRKSGALLKDFIILKNSHSLHILGATSPAWTSAFPFARHVCEKMDSPVTRRFSDPPSHDPNQGASSS